MRYAFNRPSAIIRRTVLVEQFSRAAACEIVGRKGTSKGFNSVLRNEINQTPDERCPTSDWTRPVRSFVNQREVSLLYAVHKLTGKN